ncbi:MAG: phytoene desaturase family protein [Elainellaceae cyanobacterium]
MTTPYYEADIVVIGSGIGGLSAAAVLAHQGLNVVVCESHSIPGGAAHGFERQGYRFDSGPSLHSGLSSPSTNPLRHVLDLIGEELPCATYDTWGCCLPEGDFDTQVGADQFCEVLGKLRGPAAVAEWRSLQKQLHPLGQAATALPPVALRWDWKAALTVGRFAPALLKHGWQMAQLSGSFASVMDKTVRDPFIRNWLDLLCFLLSGLPASGTSAAEMAFMFAEWYRPNVQLDYPIGGSQALVEALVRGMKRAGGELRLGTHVAQILVEQDKAVGVLTQKGETIYARRAVIASGSAWDMRSLLPNAVNPDAVAKDLPSCPSFMHLHAGFDGAGLPDLACHYIVVNDWDKGVTAPQNVVLISIPSVLDPSLAPPGKQVLHAYTPGSEPYALWEGLDRSSPEYQRQKQVRAEVLWRAVERVIPDVRDRCEVALVGTPLTHERYLRRHRGSYGPAISAADGLFPSGKTDIANLLRCGDSVFPGIGLPAVAASGLIAANTLTPLPQQFRRLQRLGY